MHTLPTVPVGQGKKNPGAVPGLDKPITWLEVLSALNRIPCSITLYIPVLFGLGIRISFSSLSPSICMVVYCHVKFGLNVRDGWNICRIILTQNMVKNGLHGKLVIAAGLRE